jgi:hypothetical protein
MLNWEALGHYQVIGELYRVPIELSGAYFSVRAYAPDHPESTEWIRGGWISLCIGNAYTPSNRLFLNKEIIYRSIREIPLYQIQITPPDYLSGMFVEVRQTQPYLELYPPTSTPPAGTGHTASLSFSVDLN